MIEQLELPYARGWPDHDLGVYAVVEQGRRAAGVASSPPTP